MSADILPFPPRCERAPVCVQATRIALLEERHDTQQTQLDRIEGKLDRLQWWILGLAVSAVGGVFASALAIGIRLLPSR